MPTPSRPTRGSKGYSPRKRAESEVPKFNSWPSESGEPSLQGFAGYKAGMTHVMKVNDTSDSPKEGMTESVPVTIVETPPIHVAAVRGYRDTPYGKRPVTDVWSDTVDPELERSSNVPDEVEKDESDLRGREDDISEVRAVAYTMPDDVDAVPRKKPDLMEIPVGGGDVSAKLDYGFDLLDRELDVDEVHEPGQYVDVSAITKGKGLQGPVKRWGVQLRKGKHKRQGWRRRIGNLGPWHPSRVMSTVPQQGQTGYHQRTDANKRVLAVEDDGEDATPDGGFVNYGEVSGPHLLVKGSVPGPEKRLVRTRDAVDPKRDDVREPEIRYVSTTSNQG
ncbi:MAG: 50S ribosomal protein L3 [Halobacteria archaeon]